MFAPEDALPETVAADLKPCVTRPRLRVIPAGQTEPSMMEMEVVNVSTDDDDVADIPRQTYWRIPTTKVHNLDHHGAGWGRVFFAVIIPRAEGQQQQQQHPMDAVYRFPSPDDFQTVAIKQLRKAVVQQYLQAGGHEDPYTEIIRMQTVGDDVHVLGCIEALEDEEFLYIIMPRCEDTLLSWLPWAPAGEGVEEEQAKLVFSQIIENLKYLHEAGICHRDISPDNCMIYQGRVVFCDLARSFLIPTHNGGWMTPATHGTQPYVPPELFAGLSYNAYGVDVWAAVVILFNLLTGEILYHLPHFTDNGFRYFIMAQGVSRVPQNERTVEILNDPGIDEPERLSLWRKAMKCLGMSEAVLELFEHSLRFIPAERWNRSDIEASAFMTARNNI